MDSGGKSLFFYTGVSSELAGIMEKKITERERGGGLSWGSCRKKYENDRRENSPHCPSNSPEFVFPCMYIY